jgi:hypothetical protein
VKATAYVPTTSYTKTLPEYVEIYATPERALRAGEILWRRGARYLVKVEVTLEQPFSRRFEKYGKGFCRRDNVRVVKVRAAR